MHLIRKVAASALMTIWLAGMLLVAPVSATGPLLSIQVAVAPGVSLATVAAEIRTYGYPILSFHADAHGLLVRAPVDAQEVLRSLLGVSAVAPDPIVQANWSAKGQMLDDQWYLDAIHAPDAWQITHGQASVLVAVIDTGADFSHPDLRGKLVAGRDFIHNTNTPNDDNGHGTLVVGIIAANPNNTAGIAGVGGDTRVLVIKALNASATGVGSSIADAVYYATKKGARIINMSLGDNTNDPFLDRAINNAYSKGVLVIAAGGNKSSPAPFWPAATPHAFGVGASNADGSLASFSDYSAPDVQLTAPGVNILSTARGGKYRSVGGTSVAAPLVAATAALMLSLNPKLTPTQMIDYLTAGADPAPDGRFGAGYLDTGKTLALVAQDFPPANTAITINGITTSVPATDSVLSLSFAATGRGDAISASALLDAVPVAAFTAPPATGGYPLTLDLRETYPGWHRLDLTINTVTGLTLTRSYDFTTGAVPKLPVTTVWYTPAAGAYVTRDVQNMIPVALAGFSSVGIRQFVVSAYETSGQKRLMLTTSLSPTLPCQAGPENSQACFSQPLLNVGTLPGGSYRLVATAVDIYGNRSAAASLSLNLNDPPLVPNATLNPGLTYDPQTGLLTGTYLLTNLGANVIATLLIDGRYSFGLPNMTAGGTFTLPLAGFGLTSGPHALALLASNGDLHLTSSAMFYIP